MKKRAKYVAYGIPAVLLGGFLAWRIIVLMNVTVTGGRPSERPPVAVELAPVEHTAIREIREFTGTSGPLYRYVVAPKVSGRVMVLTKRIGDPVKRGEVVARLDDAEYNQAFAEAEANFRIAQASLVEAEGQFALSGQELERMKSLQAKGISSSSELDLAETSYKAQQARLNLAKAQVEQREAAMNSARIRLGYTVLTTSEPGYVGERFVDEGALLSPNTPVLSVVGIDRIIVRTSIIERDYGLIKSGQVADVIVDAYPERTFGGRVARIAPMLQESARVAEMEVEVENDSLLIKPGMFTTVRVIVNEHDNAQVVPSRAVVHRQGDYGVFTVLAGADTASYHKVEIGIVTPNMTEILSPVLDGMVVVLGQHLLSDGSSVILPGAEPSSVPGQGNEPRGRRGGPRGGGGPAR